MDLEKNIEIDNWLDQYYNKKKHLKNFYELIKNKNDFDYIYEKTKIMDNDCDNIIGCKYNIQGLLYLDDDIRNYEAGLICLNRAADFKNSDALYTLACLHYEGDIVTKDDKYVLFLLNESVNLGNSDAMNTLAKMYYYGNIVDKNYENAINLYEKALLNGNDSCISNIFTIGDEYLVENKMDLLYDLLVRMCKLKDKYVKIQEWIVKLFQNKNFIFYILSKLENN